jgi:hypothetical protein
MVKVMTLAVRMSLCIFVGLMVIRGHPYNGEPYWKFNIRNFREDGLMEWKYIKEFWVTLKIGRLDYPLIYVVWKAGWLVGAV